MKAVAIVAALAACGGGPRFLGAPIPEPCRAGHFEACSAAVRDRELRAMFDVGEDDALERYVQHVVDRLARRSHLARAPRVTLEERGSTAYVNVGPRLAISRALLVWVGSESELAGVLAHELGHLEGTHVSLAEVPGFDGDRWYAARRDAEAIADERAVELLELAGYDPTALVRVYERRLEELVAAAKPGEKPDLARDDEHPPLDVTIARLHALLGTRAGGFDGRADYLAHVDHAVVIDPRLGATVDGAWVVARLGVALPATARVYEDPGRNHVTIGARDVLVLGTTWARELATRLEDRTTRHTAIGDALVGTMGPRPHADDPLARALDRWRDDLVAPVQGVRVAIVERPRGALVISVPADKAAELDAALAALRVASRAELVATAPVRIDLTTASRAATVRELVRACLDPKTALGLEDPERKLAKGEQFKCTNRVAPPTSE